MTTRAKFKVDSVTKYVNSTEITASPVTSGSEENKAFWKYTPGGSLKLSCVNPETVEAFAPGKEFYIDLTPVE